MYKLLIADDEQIERDALKAIVNKGIDSILDIQEAVNGREAIVKSQTYLPDIVFLDIKMPGIDGIEAAKTIRKNSPSVSIVFLTAFNQFEYAQEAIQIGVDDFIIKPSSETRVLEVINKILLKIKNNRTKENRNKNNELKLNKVTGYMENEFIYNLAVTGITDEKFNNYLAILDMGFYSGRAGIVKILYDTYPIHVGSDNQKKVLIKRSAFIIKSVLSEYGLVTLFNSELSNLYFIPILEKHSNQDQNLDKNDPMELSNFLAAEIEKTLNLKVIIGIGTTFTNPVNSLKSFAQAKATLGDITYENYKSDLNTSESAFPLYLEIDMEQAILNGNRENTTNTLHNIREWFDNTDSEFETKKKYIPELVTVLKHAAAYQLPNGKCIVDEIDMKDSLSSINLFSGFNIFLNELLEQVSSAKEIENSPAIEAACLYIDKNYLKDITLEETASHCRLSSFYFSKLFKKEKGITFIDYLTAKRIGKAKKLLLNSNLSIKEISTSTGYSDPNYFTKVFKKVEFVSPSTFRNNKILK
jgi:two-component system, response regulator YesN